VAKENDLLLKERRSARRFGLRLPLIVRWRRGSTPAEATTESKDVSSHGIYFLLPGEVKRGAPLEVVMMLPHEVTMAGPVQVRCLGRVQRIERQSTLELGVAAVIERYEFVRDGADAP